MLLEEPVRTGQSPPSDGLKLTRLEYQCPPYVHISTIASGLNALRSADERTDDESGSLADAVERAKFDGHGRQAL
jgi:hypothetical protein